MHYALDYDLVDDYVERRAALRDELQQFVDADPCVAHGLVRSSEIRPWTVGVGSGV